MNELQDILNMRVSVGSGNATFPMKRGSFKYKERLHWKHSLVTIGITQKDNCYQLLCRDDKTGNTGKVFVEVLEERYRIHFEFDELEANRFWVTFPTKEQEHIYGCGETFSEFDLKGLRSRIWVAEHQNSNRISKKIIKEKLTGKHPKRKLPFEKYESYYVQPTFVSSEKYYVHVDGSAYMEFDFRKKSETCIYMRAANDIYIENADSFEDLSEQLTARLGRQRVLPDWIYDGVILAVQEGTNRIQEKIDLANAYGIQVNGIWSQDWSGCRRTGFGYQVMWNWEWDKELYPNLDQKITEWKTQGIHFLGYINPFLAIEKELYRYATGKGYCVKDKEGKDYLVTITTFPAAMIDFTNPDAYEWYKSVIKDNMIGIGMSGWMADFGEYLPPDAVLYSGENPQVIHNEWPAIWARMNREAICECGVEDDVFFFTRAGYTETIQYSTMMWNGDQHVDWSIDDGLPSVIPATLSLAMSGYGITHSDAGGYTTIMHMRRDKELLMRWEEMNVFSPLLRTHEGNQPVNNIQFDGDEELLKHLGAMSKLHAGLKPYLQELVRQEQEKGTPVMRPLFYHYDEPNAYVESQEYLLGKDILVAPVVVAGTTTRNCYLPEDTWIHLFSGKEYTGGNHIVDAPIGKPPVFIRKDSMWCEKITKLFEN